MWTYLLFALAGASAALLTFYLQKWGCSAVVASCVVGLLGALIGQLSGDTSLPLVIFAGSFVGMTSLNIGSVALMLLAGALAGMGVEASSTIFKGFGGKLGTLAFLSTLLMFYFLSIVKKVIHK